MMTQRIENGRPVVRDVSALALVLAWAAYLAAAPFVIAGLVVWLWPKNGPAGFLAMLAAVAAFLAIVVAYDLPIPH